MTRELKGPIEVVCDGGGRYGLGHIRRSSTLVNALERKKYEVTLTVLSQLKGSSLSEHKFGREDSALKIIDLPYEIRPWLDAANKKNISVVALDYFGDALPAMTISIYEHRNPPPPGLRFSGLEYAIIRPSITHLAPTLDGEDIVVMIGGSDINQVGESVASYLGSAGKSVYLIQGPATKGKYAINLPNVDVLLDPANLESLMSKCEWGVTNGGGSMMEMMCLGKAVHVIPQTIAELNLAKLIYNKGALLGIGLDTLRIPSLEEIARVGTRARELVDGRGVDRIIGLVESCINE